MTMKILFHYFYKSLYSMYMYIEYAFVNTNFHQNTFYSDVLAIFNNNETL